MLSRLWLFTARVGNYPEGGTYDTSVLNSDIGDCSDAQQFDRFQVMLAYASQRGEKLQQVASAQEAYAMCSRARATAPTKTPLQTVGSTGSFQGSVLEHAVYNPANAQVGICGCQCTGGGSKSTPPQLYDPNIGTQLMTYTPADNANRIIELTRQKARRIGTIVY